MNIGSREEGRGDKEEGSDVGKEEDSIHESFLRPPESTLRPIYLRTIERKEGGQTDGAQTRKKESQTLTRATKSVGGRGRSCNNARWLRVDDIGDERWVDSWLKESTPSSGMKWYLIAASVYLLLIQHPCQFNQPHSPTSETDYLWKGNM